MGNTIEALDDLEAINEEFYMRNWTDGLPVVPPTEERVARMLQGTRRKPDDVVAILEPRQGIATVEVIAANAVMAGCKPEYLPVLIGAVEAMGNPTFNLYGILTSTHNVSPLVLVNGPLARELDISSGLPHTPNRRRASATIGRAIVLITINVAGIPGGTHVDTQEPIGRHYHCIAENEAESPWEPLHVERGFPAEQSTVTVFGTSCPQHLDDMGSTGPQGVLRTFGLSVANSANRNMHGASEPVFLFGFQHAHTVAKDGWSKAEVKRFFYENARVRRSAFSEENLVVVSDMWRKRYDGGLPDPLYPMADRPEDIVVVVMGGRGTHSLFLEVPLGYRSVTVPVQP